MAVVTALLIRYAGGWTEATDTAGIAAYGRREDFLELGHIGTAAEAQRIAAALFETMARPISSGAAVVEPVGDVAGFRDTPYLLWGVGDTVPTLDQAGALTAQRVQALTVAEDGDGSPTFTAEVQDRAVDAAERLRRQLRNAPQLLGTTSARVVSSSPVGASQQAAYGAVGAVGYESVTFHLPGEVDVVESDPWPVVGARYAVDATALLSTPAVSGDTTVTVNRNGAAIGAALTIPEGAATGSADLSTSLLTGDGLTVEVTASGVSAAGLVVVVRIR